MAGKMFVQVKVQFEWLSRVIMSFSFWIRMSSSVCCSQTGSYQQQNCET